MARTKIPVTSVSQICIESQPLGLRAVYLVETQRERDSSDIHEFFKDFAPVLQTRQLSYGKLVAYAVQLRAQDQSLLDEIESFLKHNFGFVIMHRSFDLLIYDIVRELCRDSGSSLASMPKCDICGKPEPFPETAVSLLDNDNAKLATRFYCATCTAESARRSNKEFIRALLDADRFDFGLLKQMDLIRKKTSKKRIAFRIKTDAEQWAIT